MHFERVTDLGRGSADPPLSSGRPLCYRRGRHRRVLAGSPPCSVLAVSVLEGGRVAAAAVERYPVDETSERQDGRTAGRRCPNVSPIARYPWIRTDRIETDICLLQHAATTHDTARRLAYVIRTATVGVSHTVRATQTCH